MKNSILNIHNKRKYYLKKAFYGKNNKGIITSRSKQSTVFCFKHIKNYKYLFINLVYNNFISNKGIYIKIIDIYKCKKYNQEMHKVIFLNSVLKKNIEYISISQERNIGDVIFYGSKISSVGGNIIPIYLAPVGVFVHNVEHIPTRGSVFVKNSKKSAFLISKGVKYVIIKLPSGELRLLSKYVLCVLGNLNLKKVNNKYYKAGYSRLIGRRPIVRGSAKNVCDHPHGGGEGKAPIGRKSCMSLWGVLFKGKKTRMKKKYSNKYIIK